MLSRQPLTHREALSEYWRETKEYAKTHPWSSILEWGFTLVWYGYLLHLAKTNPIVGWGLIVFIVAVKIAAYLGGRRERWHSMTRSAERAAALEEQRAAYLRGVAAGKEEAGEVRPIR